MAAGSIFEIWFREWDPDSDHRCERYYETFPSRREANAKMRQLRKHNLDYGFWVVAAYVPPSPQAFDEVAADIRREIYNEQ